MDYLSFDLRLGEWNPASSTGVVEVLRSPAGESERCPFVLDVDFAWSSKRVYRSSAMAAEVGRKLAESILSQESLTLWDESYQIARERSRGLRLRLQIDSWELSRLPWELLYDARQGDFLVFDPMVSLVRYLRLHTAPPALRQSERLKVMAVVSSPRDQAQLAWKRELAVLEDALKDLVESEQMELVTCEHATQEKLHVALLENRPDVVHYVGHAEYDQERHRGVLLLEDVSGRSAPRSATQIARMLKRYRVNLVVLNACETASGAWAGLAPTLVRAEIPAVVAMQWPVEDRAATRFSQLFYRALSLGGTIDECVAEGRLASSAVSSAPGDWGAPVLFLRSASGRLWVNDIASPRKGEKETPSWPEVGFRRALTRPGVPPLGEGELLFKYRGPLSSDTDAERIIDRPELRRALRLARQPSVTQYIALLSARQTGKTTLLFRLTDLLQDSCACIYIDLSVLRAQDARACFRLLAFRLVSEFRALLAKATPLPEMARIEGAVDFLEFLSNLADVTPMPRIIILLDEVGALSPQVSDSFFNTLRTVFSQGRGLNSQLSKYLFVFSGAADLYSLTFGINPPLDICQKLYLRDFELPDVRAVVGQFDRLGVAVPSEAADQIYHLAGGHPYLTMRLCALLEMAGVTELTPDRIDMAAERMIREDENIRRVTRELDRHPPERRTLRDILVEGRRVPFSRNDPVLASLEMIGAIRATQPCQIRNRLYECALRQYYARLDREPARSERVSDHREE